MNELMVLCQVGPFSITAFGLCVAAGALLALALTAVLGRREPGVNGVLSLGASTIIGALLGARVLYCLTTLSTILVDMEEGAAFIPQLWQGGYTLYGAVLGGGAGAWLYARAARKPVGAVLDLAAAGGALALVCERLGEYFTSQGLGDFVREEAWQRFPFAVQSAYEDWQVPIFVYEALAAFIILVVLLCMRGRTPAGRGAEVFILLLGTTQIILESLRADEFIRFGFVRLNMLAAAITMAPVFIARVIRSVRRRGWMPWQVIRIALFVLCATAVIVIEFALDKSDLDNTLLYFIMAGVLAAMAVSALADGQK